MHVAHEFGRLDVDAMLAELSASQLAEWSAFFALKGMTPEEREKLTAPPALDPKAEAAAMKNLLSQIGITRGRSKGKA